MTYRGRFAPTPSGPLHLGSLLTALASHLQARSVGGQWRLRMDDLDRPRCVDGADSQIQRQLEAHALGWDGPVRYQSRHVTDYRAMLARLEARALLYPCTCTRAELARDFRLGADGPVYRGTCREQTRSATDAALRLRLHVDTVEIEDGWQGRLQRRGAEDIGDFVVQRADGQIAYQLACVVDESAMEITEVVRGADLIGSTFRQCVLMAPLGLKPPAYRHLPVLVDRDGRKLSKQNHASALDPAMAAANLIRCLRLLGQAPPASIESESPSTIVAWAVRHWQPGRVPAGDKVIY